MTRVLKDDRLKGPAWQFIHLEPDGWMYFSLETRLMRMKVF